MKTFEKSEELKQEAETVNRKLNELTDEELAQVSGGGSGVLVYENNSGGNYEGDPKEIVWHSNSDAGASNDKKIVVFP